VSLELIAKAEGAELLEPGSRAAEDERREPGRHRDAGQDNAEDAGKDESREGEHEPEERHEARLPTPVGRLDLERMPPRVQRIGVGRREQRKPCVGLALVPEMRGEKPVESSRYAAGDEGGDPAHGQNRHDQDAPDEEDDVVGNEEQRPQEHDQAPASQRLRIVHPEPPRIHGGYRRPVRGACALTLALLLLPACGGGGETLTRQEYAQKADAICAKGKTKTSGLPTPANLQELARVADETLDALGDARNNLEKLKPPPEERAVATQWLATIKRLEDDVARIRDHAKANNRRAVYNDATKAQTRNARANELATRLGLTVCNKN
jgi:hypothetical protein